MMMNIFMEIWIVLLFIFDFIKDILDSNRTTNILLILFFISFDNTNNHIQRKLDNILRFSEQAYDDIFVRRSNNRTLMANLVGEAKTYDDVADIIANCSFLPTRIRKY